MNAACTMSIHSMLILLYYRTTKEDKMLRCMQQL